ncbi:MAG: DUF3137 domain-containing protein [Alphaproteobacteria bacterium]|nr:DUF3137 domain-containing protein [Alphaproteobacteria bacterium]
MTSDKPQSFTVTLNSGGARDIQKRDDLQFQAKIDSLIREGEDMRLKYMRRAYGRTKFKTIVGILSALVGGAAFGWLFLMQGRLAPALLSILASFALPIFLGWWASLPPKAYLRDYKRLFMPRIAEALGGLTFHPARGISSAILGKTGIMPPHDIYKAEDCFMGVHKGVKVMLSEARLWKKSRRAPPVFQGLLILLEIPSAAIEGHTIITADETMVHRWEKTRWKKLQRVQATFDSPLVTRFQIFSDHPESASLLIGDRLLKELGEAADVFGKSPLTAVLFRGKYIFLSIPYAEDMFEPSSIFHPVATKQHTLRCRHEIERIMEIIDIFELYNPGRAAMASSPTSRPAE